MSTLGQFTKVSRKIRRRNVRRCHSTAMASLQYFFGGKYDMIQHTVIHQNARISLTTSNFYSKLKENNENDMTFC